MDAENNNIDMFKRAPFILRLVSSAVKVSETAGDIIRGIMHEGTLNIVSKGGMNDLQTEADRKAQTSIIASLRAQFNPVKFNIIGEEEDDEDALAKAQLESGFALDVLSKTCPLDLENIDEREVVVWVDPLDGTAEFTQSKDNPELREHVTVLIGIAYKGLPIAGVIHQPYYRRDEKAVGRTIWGIQGIGSFGLHSKKPSPTERIITTTRSHSNEEVNSAINALQPTEVLRVGGAGHKVLLVIEGKAHAYVFASPGCKKWDTCAPEAVLNAIGFF